MKPLKWGVVSTARIGLEKVLPAMARSPDCEIVAIASRDRARAATAARKLAIPKAYGAYEDLFADAEVEAVYNPLPNHLHVPVSIQAIEAGKHVLCEKPLGMTADEVCRGSHWAKAIRTPVDCFELFCAIRDLAPRLL